MTPPLRLTFPAGTSSQAAALAVIYTDTLAAQLGIPLSTDGITDPSRDLDGARGARYLTLGEHRTLVAGWGTEDEQEQARLLCQAIARNREQLVDAAMPTLWHQWGGAPGVPAPVLTFAREAVRRGRTLSGLGPRLKALAARHADPDELGTLFEEAFNEDGPPHVVLALSPRRKLDLMGNSEAASSLEAMREGLYYDLGIGFRLSVEEDKLLDDQLRVDLGAIRGCTLPGLPEGHHLVNATPERLSLLGIKARSAVNPTTGATCGLVASADVARCKEVGLGTWSATDYIFLALFAELRGFAGSSITTDLLEALFQRFSDAGHPHLVSVALERFSLPRLARVWRALLDEEISVRDQRTILEGLLTVQGTTSADFDEKIVFTARAGLQFPSVRPRPPEQLSAEELAECARMALRSYVSQKYTQGGSTLAVYLLQPIVERRVAAAGDHLPRALRHQLVDAIWKEVGRLPASAPMPVLLTTLTARRYLWRAIARDLPQLAVLSYSELSPELNIQPLARIELDGAALGGPGPPARVELDGAAAGSG